MASSSTPGILKVFLGMCPGVGKTYAMLQAARELLADGVDVVAGVVETHGRKETAALLDGLEIVPPAILRHRETDLTELDLDALLARRPRIALIDELAHTNVPGSRHVKRWQDVAELLEAGIDVLTTVNIQHLESRADVVTAITSVPVRETVPDAFLDRAQEIELVDLTPRDLQRRLEEGKVYLGDRARAAAENFFKESHLTALRQLALRYTAERVGVDLREFESRRRGRKTWRTEERLLVAIGPSPFCPALIRRTRAMAGALDAPWSAIAVLGDTPFSPAEQDAITRHLSLARQLGAEAATVEDVSLTAGLISAAREHRATQIVIGKSPRHRWRDILSKPPALRLLQESGEIDIIAIEPGSEGEGISSLPTPPGRRLPDDWISELLRTAAIAAVIVLLAYACDHFLASEHVPLLILCGVIVGALFLRSWGTLLLAFVSGMLWNFLFTEPLYSFRISSSSDVAMFAALTVAALAMGHLSNRLHRRERSVTRQQRHYARLLEINTILTSSHDTGETVTRCISAVTSLFGFPCAIQLRDDNNQRLMPPDPASTLSLTGKDRGVAEWTFEKKQPAGKGTATLAEATAMHLPLQGRALVMGVLSVDPGDRAMPLAERDQLASVAAQLGLALERNHLLRAIHRAEFLERGDQLRRSLLDHVSHELRTPVAVISTAIDALAAGAPGEALLTEMRHARTRLRRVVDQLVESARVESGAISPRPEWCDLLDLLETARDRDVDLLGNHPLEISIAPDTPPLVQIDGELLLTALGNLLANAAHHTPPGTAIQLHAVLSDDGVLEIKIRDHGPGLENPAHVFDRFVRGAASRPGGLGLGLSIVRGLARGLGGDATADNAATGGAEFTLSLPVHTATEIPTTP